MPELLKRWQLGELTEEQMLGQLLQHIIALEQQVGALEQQQRPTPNHPRNPGEVER